jgi:hypothetical protein
MAMPTLEPVCTTLLPFKDLTTDYQTENDWGKAGVNITQKGNFYKADYKYKLTPLKLVPTVAKLGAGVGRIW